jgi:hypothetical protein
MTEDANVPALVERAMATASATGFPLTRNQAGTGLPSASLPGTGRFLAVLAASCRGGRLAELGTGVGIGSAWLASATPALALPIDSPLRGHDPKRDLFATDGRLLWTEVVLDDLRNSLLVGARIT